MNGRKTPRENLPGPHRFQQPARLIHQEIDKEGFASKVMIFISRTEPFIQTETGVKLDEFIHETHLISESEKQRNGKGYQDEEWIDGVSFPLKEAELLDAEGDGVEDQGERQGGVEISFQPLFEDEPPKSPDVGREQRICCQVSFSMFRSASPANEVCPAVCA